MARYGYGRNSYRKRSAGHQKAIEHIRAAKALSTELGGTDKDVKEYFFNLSQKQLGLILNKYEKMYSKKARDYAQKTLPKWRSGKVHMSGQTAERLFKLLPPIMPIEKKFELVESLWNHVGPSSSKIFYFGSDVSVKELHDRVKTHLETVVINHELPKSFENRFNWLSQGDVNTKQKLLNFFRQKEKELLTDALRTNLPILINYINGKKGNFTTHIAQEIRVGKHEVKVKFNNRVNGVSEKLPPVQYEKSSGNWLLWAIGIFLLYLFLAY